MTALLLAGVTCRQTRRPTSFSLHGDGAAGTRGQRGFRLAETNRGSHRQPQAPLPTQSQHPIQSIDAHTHTPTHTHRHRHTPTHTPPRTVKHVCSCCSNVDDFWASVSLRPSKSTTFRLENGATQAARRAKRRSTHIFLLHDALGAVVRVAFADAAADDAPAFVTTVVALVTDAHQLLWAHVRVADHALAVACT